MSARLRVGTTLAALRRGVFASAVFSLAACSSAPTDATANPRADDVVAVTDPVGDTFAGVLNPWDITELDVTRSASLTTVQLDFTTPVALTLGANPAGLIGVLEFDVDHDASTGLTTALDVFRRDGGSSGMKADYQLFLGDVSADSSMLVQDVGGRTVGRAKAVVDGRRLTIRIPNALLGGTTSNIGVDVIVGRFNEPSDFAPQQGHVVTPS